MFNRSIQTKLFALGATLIPCMAFSNAAAAAEGAAILGSATPVSDTELADTRGGFFVAAGAQFDFGASIRTMVNGKLALQTNLQWTPAGAVTRHITGMGTVIQAQVAANLARSGIAPNALDVADAGMPVTDAPLPAPVTAGTGTAGTAEAAPVIAAPVASASTMAAGETAPAVIAGVQIPGATGGTTQAFANLGAGQLQNIVINSASGQTIVQNTNVALTIYNFQAWQQQMAVRALSTRLTSDMLAAAGFGGAH